MKNLTVWSALVLLVPALACGDSGGSEVGDESGSEDSGSEGATADEEGEGDVDTTGDGDGDTTGDGDGDTTGDGDGDTTGDGDGDTTGDGDGDTTGDGDGDGGMECVPMNDSPCAVCSAENCCPELQACEADEDCSCFFECLPMAVNPMQCINECGIDPMTNLALMELRACNNSNCMQECAMGGG